jgi:hypothetical protein
MAGFVFSRRWSKAETPLGPQRQRVIAKESFERSEKGDCGNLNLYRTEIKKTRLRHFERKATKLLVVEKSFKTVTQLNIKF